MRKVLAVVAVAVLGLCTDAVGETNYAFRARMAEVHPNWLRVAGVAPRAADEIGLQDGPWSIRVAMPDPDGVMAHAAADLRDYLAKSMGVKVVDGVDISAITLAVDPSLPPLQSKVAVRSKAGRRPASVAITGATPREVLQGCYRLEDLLTARGLPVMKVGERTFTRMYAPRMVHSGYELEKFPDWHLDQIAHAGMDAIIIYVSDPPDVTRNGRVDMNDMVRRAKVRGLDVYAYAHFCRKAARMHPLDPGAREWYDATYGAIVKNAPGLKGLICVGESAAFPSRDEGVRGYWWQREKGAKYLNGFWPSSDWPDWIRLVAEVTQQYRSDFDLVFWTYNWYWAPEKERLALLERIPTNVTLHVTYEMGDTPERKLGVDTWIDDYSITRPGPGTVFRSEAAVARRRGIRLTSMTNTGGRNWDFGALPYLPSPFSWLARFRALRTSRDDFGLVGLMDSHHYGFTPSVISELAKSAFTVETSDAELERKLEEIAARDFGAANTSAVLAVWHEWDEAMKWHSARNFDQYGPLRLGPTYPFTLPERPLPVPPDRTDWKYVSGVFSMPKELIDPYIAMAEREHAHWKAGADRLEAALDGVPATRRDAARRMLGIGRYCEHAIRTSLNQKRFYREALQPQPNRERMRAILDDEEQNVRETIPLVEFDSQLGFEPSMRYVTDPKLLNWKLEQLNRLRSETAK